MSSSQLQSFMAALSPEHRLQVVDEAEIVEALHTIAEGAREVWPSFKAPDDLFFAHVAARLDAELNVIDALKGLFATDLYLAFHCSKGLPKALSEFERVFGPDIESALRAMRMPVHVVEEVKQEVRRRLFVADEGATPRIATYSGRSGLRFWIKTTTVRVGLRNLSKTREAPLLEEELLLLPSSSANPELEALKHDYREEAKLCFEEAVGIMTPRQRNLLRFHYIDHLSIDEVAKLMGIHRATAARWVNGAREAVVSNFQKLLASKLGLNETEIRGVLTLVQSQLELSLQRLLR